VLEHSLKGVAQVVDEHHAVAMLQQHKRGVAGCGPETAGLAQR
jgi:hypothetical protein